jgi:hypothetical protein
VALRRLGARDETEVLRRLREQRHPDTTPDQLRADVLRGTTTGGTTAGVLVITNPRTEPPTAVLNGRPVTAAAQPILCAARPGLPGSVPEAPAGGAYPMRAR